MYVYWLKIIKYCCIYIDIDKEHYVLKLARCLDYWFFDLVVTKTRAFLFFSCSLFFFFPFFSLFLFLFCCCCCCCSFFSFFNWKEKLSFRAWKGSEIYRSNSRCSTISHSKDTRLTDLSTFLFLLLLLLFFSSFSTFDINESEKIRQLRSKESV